MRAFIFGLVVSSGVCCCTTPETKTSKADVSIVPKPVRVELKDGAFTMDGEVSLIAETDEEKQVAPFLEEILKTRNISIDASADQKIKIVLVNGDSVNREGYQVKINDEGIAIRGYSASGLFYGIQTLAQLFPTDGENELPYITITDYPRFPYRGLHLDVGRHMFPVAFVKKYIDLLSKHKFNKFHWHLTEDQGWRIEIKKYPRLQEVAAFRSETVVGLASTRTRKDPHEFDGKRYGGFYTQEEIKEIVKYAAQRYVEVIPEIELPGHAMAALAAYPQLGCTGGPYQTATTWGIFPDVYCAGKEQTFEFLQAVMDEVMTLFPSKYIHVGGDEVFNKYFKTSWETCPHCQKRMKTEKLKDVKELQSYFIRRMEKYLNGKGKTIIGWDEILEGGLAENATVMSWRGEEGGIAAAKQKHDVIMSPENWFYLDHAQDTSGADPLTHSGYTPLGETYSYNPIPSQLTKEEAGRILGVQGNVWTEYMKTPEHVEYMTYPRACAIAEIAWSPASNRTYANFLQRLRLHARRLEAWDVNYAKHFEKDATLINAKPASGK
jgi:hexosaminidase